MRHRELNTDKLPDADDTWWSQLSPDERMEFDPSRYFQEAWITTCVEARFQIEQEYALSVRIQAEKQPRHAGERSLAAGVLALLRNGIYTPQHRADGHI